MQLSLPEQPDNVAMIQRNLLEVMLFSWLFCRFFKDYTFAWIIFELKWSFHNQLRWLFKKPVVLCFCHYWHTSYATLAWETILRLWWKIEKNIPQKGLLWCAVSTWRRSHSTNATYAKFGFCVCEFKILCSLKFIHTNP